MLFCFIEQPFPACEKAYFTLQKCPYSIAGKPVL